MAEFATPSVSARELAHDVLNRAAGRGQAPSRHLDELLPGSGLSAGSRGHATDLVHGVLRRQPTLDLILRRFVRRPLGQVEEGALQWLRLATWELLFSTSAPQYAILNETAESVKRTGNPQWTGFINGVLRAVTRELTDETLPGPAADALPCERGRYRRLLAPVFPDPAADPVGYFRDAFSFPEWLTQRWSLRFPTAELYRMGFWFNSPPLPTLRANTLRIPRDELLQRLRDLGIEAVAGGHPHAIRLARTLRVADLAGFDDGLFAVQDESAMGAASLLAPRPGERILDLCAAPGGKTTHLAALLENQGEIVAADVDPHRLNLVDASCARLGARIVRTQIIPRDSSRLPKGPFDGVLVDVPCSNTGVLGKRPEVRWRLSSRDLAEMRRIQSRLLDAALSAVRPGGRVVYSTCSIEPDENELLVRQILAQRPQFEIAAEFNHRPAEPADGGYQALLRFAAGSSLAEPPK